MLASACASSCLAVRRARSRFPEGIDLAACWEHKLIRLALKFCAGGVACEVLARYSRVAFVLYAAWHEGRVLLPCGGVEMGGAGRRCRGTVEVMPCAPRFASPSDSSLRAIPEWPGTQAMVTGIRRWASSRAACVCRTRRRCVRTL